MPRGPRIDYPGATHHVFNRGTARRTLFEYRRDMRAFQALLARTVKSGLLEVHAFALLTTHFHLLVGSPDGRIAEAMWRIQNGYVRRFNRVRRRDGPLLRGRYGSRIVESAAYFETLVRYIDRNPVDARMAAAPHLYPYGSARLYAARRRPRWLRTDRVEALVCDVTSAPTFRRELYPRFASTGSDANRELVEARLAATPDDADPLDDLVRAAPIEVQRWMEQRAGLADGTEPGVVALAAQSIVDVIDAMGVPEPPRTRLAGGLLRGLAGLTFAATGRRLGCCYGSARSASIQHTQALRTDSAYAALAATVVHGVIRRDFGPPLRAFDLPRRLPRAGIVVDAPERGFAGGVGVWRNDDRCLPP